MRICAVKKSAVRFLALATLLLGQGFAGVGDGIVLCFGDDGHIAIEAVGPEGCREVVETADHPASASSIPVWPSHCGPCVDVALTQSSAAEGIHAAKRTISAPASIPTAELRRPIPHLRASISYQHSTRFISEKPHTVVIRS